MFKKILIFLLIGLIIIQFFHPKKNISAAAQNNYIGNAFPVPENVKSIMSKACTDCHSNNTVYPWYAKIQPVHWWLNNHINDGKRHVNYDEYLNKPLRFQYHKMEETIDMIKNGEMPLNSYTWVHKDAVLNENEKNIMISWANSVMDYMKSKYPLDSLIRKK
jgi:hypothetical protein